MAYLGNLQKKSKEPKRIVQDEAGGDSITLASKKVIGYPIEKILLKRGDQWDQLGGNCKWQR